MRDYGFWFLMLTLAAVGVSLAIPYVRRMRGSKKQNVATEASESDGIRERKDGPTASDEAWIGRNERVSDSGSEKDTSGEEDVTQQGDKIRAVKENRDLLMSCLQNMGCSPVVNDDERVLFRFQGEAFAVAILPSFIRIWDLPFSEIDQFDHRIPLMLEAINAANESTFPTLILSEPTAEGKREIFARLDLYFCGRVQEPERYLNAMLKLFFDIKDRLRVEVAERFKSSTPNPAGCSVDPSLN